MIRVFMDSSALFAAVMSATGAARELIRLAVNEELELVISEDVVVETRRNIGRKAPELLPLFDQLLEAIELEVVPRPKKSAVKATEQYVAQKDAFIVAAAIEAEVDYLTTFDRRHLMDPPQVRSRSGLKIELPGNILEQWRGQDDQNE